MSGRNETIQAGSTWLGYDARGNLSNSGSSSYSYTDENLLVIAPGIILSYDALGRLKGYGPTSDTTRFVHDGAEMATETSATGTILRRYVRADGDDEPLVWYEGAGTTDRRWYHADERGSIVALSDNTGAMTAINKYDEYGIPGAGNIGRFQYTGQAWIAELGLYYYKARMYSPTLGKFMQTDPVEYEDGMNWYNYAGSDPINMVDPTGLGGIGTKKDEFNFTPYPASRTSLLSDILSEASRVEINSSGIGYMDSRRLSDMEKIFFRINGYPADLLENVKLHAGLPFYLIKDAHGFTLNERDIYLTDTRSALSDRNQAGLIGHELYHAWEFSTGKLTISKYIVESAKHGYYNNPYEVRARKWQDIIMDNFCKIGECK